MERSYLRNRCVSGEHCLNPRCPSAKEYNRYSVRDCTIGAHCINPYCASAKKDRYGFTGEDYGSIWGDRLNRRFPSRNRRYYRRNCARHPIGFCGWDSRIINGHRC